MKLAAGPVGAAAKIIAPPAIHEARNLLSDAFQSTMSSEIEMVVHLTTQRSHMKLLIKATFEDIAKRELSGLDVSEHMRSPMLYPCNHP